MSTAQILKTKQFVLSGSIAAGKTTLCRFFEKQGFCIYEEPAETNPLLALFYENMDKYAFPMQIYMLNRRLESTEKIIKNGFGVQDRSIYEDKIFVNTLRRFGQFEEVLFETYNDLFSNMTDRINFPDFFVFLSVKPEVCLERIAKRGRECEKESVSIEYLSVLNEEYEKFIKDISTSVPVFWVDSDILKIDDNGASFIKLTNFIEKSLEQGLSPGITNVGDLDVNSQTDPQE